MGLQKSKLSYREYAEWCLSRFPSFASPTVSEAVPDSESAVTEYPESELCDSCPVTLRSVDSRDVITPRPRGSQ